MDRKKIPVGQDDFASLINEGYYFVDKSLFIKDLVEYRDLVNLITRPRRFGKTLNMSMLQYFFENNDGKFAHLFEKLKIAKEQQICDRHMGKYPVINLTFMNAKHNTFEDALASLKIAISDEYKRHINAVNAYSYNRRRIEAIINCEDDSVAVYNESLSFLTQILGDFYKSKVIILIDEYDVPLEAAYTGGYYEEMLNFVRSLLRSALKSNKHLCFAVLTGCLRISKESVFTGLNNFSTFTAMNTTFSEYFGFTADEVKQYLQYYNLASKMDEMREWYDGYAMFDFDIYNPWSVTKQIKAYLLEQAAPVSHWGNTSGNDIVKLLIDQAEANTKNEIEILLSGKTITKPISEDMTYAELYDNANNIWSFLFYTGYVTADKIQILNGVRYVDLQIPNKEVEYIFVTKIQEWFNKAMIDNDTLNLILKKDSELVQEHLNMLLFNAISYMDYSENYYHGIVTGLLADSGDFIMKSNRETGLGRADITLQNSRTAIVIEIKVADSRNKLDLLSQQALAQIDSRQYAEEFTCEEHIKVGIAFYKKQCSVVIA